MVEKPRIDLTTEVSNFLSRYEQKPLEKILETVPDQYREEFRAGALEIGEGIRIVGEEGERTVIIPLSPADHELSFFRARVKDTVQLLLTKGNDYALDKINSFKTIAGKQKLRRVVEDKERNLILEEIRSVSNREKREQITQNIDRFNSLVSFAEELISNKKIKVDVEKSQKVK